MKESWEEGSKETYLREIKGKEKKWSNGKGKRKKTKQVIAVFDMQASTKPSEPHCQLHLGEAFLSNYCLDSRLTRASLQAEPET